MSLKSSPLSSLPPDENDRDSSSSFDEISTNVKVVLSRPVRVRGKRKSYKRPSNNPIYMPALRILRRDIRRKYCEMLNNVINSCDATLILQFFHDFSIPNLKRVLYFPKDSLQAIHQHSIITGIEEQVKDFYVKVCKSTNISGSRVVARTSVRGTLIYSVRKRAENGGDLIECDSLAIYEDVHRVTDDLIFDPLENPVYYEMNGMIALHLDDQHRMELIEIRPLDTHISPSLSTMRIH